MISYLVKCAPGSVEIPVGSNTPVYPGVRDLAKTGEYNDGQPWEVWFMYSADVDQNGDPAFEVKPGDTILGGWWRYRNNQIAVPEHPDLFEYVRPIGNVINEATSTFDGTSDFAYYANGMGAPARWWGSTNPAPDDNQTRHVECFRYITDWAGQSYHRVRFVLEAPFDKDNAPNALAILIYTDPERQSYFYTPGAFIWEPDLEYWYCDTTIGQSPTAGPEPVYYCVALGSAPLNGGGTVPPEYNQPRDETDFSDARPVGEPEHVSFNWDQNLSGAQSGLALQDAVAHFQTRMGWLAFQVVQTTAELIIDTVDWPPGQVITLPDEPVINGSYVMAPPPWMDAGQLDRLIHAIEAAAGREVINAAP